MKPPREPFSWDGDDDKPVSPDELLGISGPKIVDEAEAVVFEAQGAIGREDTDPSITVPRRDQATSLVAARVAGLDSSVPRRRLGAGLAVVCVLAFGHGWSVGSAGAQAALPICDPGHCSSRSVSSEWKEEQRP